MSRRGRPDANLRPSAAPADRTPGRLLLLLVTVVVFSQMWLVGPLRSLPSEIYGGDLYYQLGCVRRILETGNPMASCSTCETRPGYLPLYGTLVAIAARAGANVESPEHSMLTMAVALKTVAVLALVALLTPLAGSLAAVATAALWYATHPDLILRYTSFAAEVLVPLFLLALIRLLERPGPLRALVLALAIGVAGYAHAVVFIGGVAIAGLAAAGRMLLAPRDPAARPSLLWTALAAVAGIVMALGYWYEPIFVHHGRTSLHYTEWNGGPTLSALPARLAMAGRFLAGQLDFSSLATGIASLAAWAGLVLAWRRRHEPVVATALIAAAACFAWVFHYFVTEPALGVNFIPEYAASMLWGTARMLLVGLAVAGLVALARAPGVRLAIAAGIAVVGSVLAIGAVASLAQTSAMVAARTPHAPLYDDLRRWVRANTRPDDVFLSSQELSFMLSGMTGRQVLVTRRAQNDAFADMDAHVRDAALILYGNDNAQRRHGIARWKVRYLLWTDRWLSSEYDRGDGGGITGYYDPLLYFQNAATDSLLGAAGVRLAHITGWVDPALRTPDVRQFPLTLITHENYRSFARPWHPSFDPMLRKVWAFEDGGREIAAIYAIEGR